ncbi:uncharacterized protein LOC108871579 [Brassica rapa]|uniref:uncharacterized protein LOC108871579 n=1 Tax=Brassica campestris TaxID=3711 RepID=UPI00142D6847|nr:uncharacterized protein LOC108871579 [Brassica rapa]
MLGIIPLLDTVSSTSRLSWSAGGLCYSAMVSFHLHQYASMGKWSVLRVWDVLLFEGNRVMLFRTALALMEFYGPTLITTKDAGDAITLLQSMTGSTFERSQLVFTACMGYQDYALNKDNACSLYFLVWRVD